MGSDSAGSVDVVIIGAGAAGLATAISLAQRAPQARVVVIDSARSPGAKILVSGGARCNVTNTIVTEADFNGGSKTAIRRVLRAFPADAAAAWFRGLGVALHEEPGGKLFPDSGRSRDVLDALLNELRRRGVALRASTRVHGIARQGDVFAVSTTSGSISATSVVLATGGLSLPKTGSDGAGYDLARRLGHTIVPTTPALAPLVLVQPPDTGAPGIVGQEPPHRVLAGVAHPVRLTLTSHERVAARVVGSMLWTHFGISGPAPLDMSRHWLRARLSDRSATLTASFAGTLAFDAVDAAWTARARERPRATVQSTLASDVPASVASVVIDQVAIDGRQKLAALSRDDRRRLVHALLEWPLPVLDSRGYNYAEVTAGGIDLAEVDPTSMSSRRCPGLYAVGEILDVDGRLGGFNFQWAWSSGHVAGAALATQCRTASRWD